MRSDPQGDLFANVEGDSWFERNRRSLDGWQSSQDTPIQILKESELRPSSVVELGAANGYRVAAIVAEYGCRGVAVEPSSAAIADGRSRYPDVEFYQGRIDSVPLDESFDLVIVNFVLHWVDRSRILAAVAEIDRLVVLGGHLLIGDFLPSRPTRTAYHHLPEGQAWTYKQDYPALFTTSGLYETAAALTGSHAEGAPCDNVPEQDRIGFALLSKPPGGVYVLRGSGATGS